jgi:hypothetical protein
VKRINSKPYWLSIFSYRCSGMPSKYLVVNSMARMLDLLFDQLRSCVSGDSSHFSTAATVDFTDVFDDLHLF